MVRFLTERGKDRVARLVIRAGGAVVILVVVAIVVDIAAQAVPLFRRATAGEPSLAPAPSAAVLAAGSDPRQEVVWALDETGTVSFAGAELKPVSIGARLLAADQAAGGLTAALAADGTALVGRVRLRDRWLGDRRAAEASWRPAAAPYRLPPARWRGVTAAEDSDDNLLLAAFGDDGLHLARWSGENAGWEQIAASSFPPVGQATVSERLDLVAVVLADGGLRVLRDGVDVPVEGATRPMSTARYLVGGGTLVAAGRDGSLWVLLEVPRVRVANHGDKRLALDGIVLAPGEEAVVADDELGAQLASRPEVLLAPADAIWRVVRELRNLGAPPTVIAASPRRRGFLVGGADGTVALYHATSGRRLLRDRWAEGPVQVLAADPKDDGATLWAGGSLQHRTLSNPHPEVSLGTLFGRVWYEGYAAPRWVWQSTGGSNDVEPKLSLLPLLLGTLKATLYAMLFSVPMALAAAVYVSQLAPGWVQSVVKPTVELMAAVPSVVVGFVAALWLGPRLESALMAGLLAVIALPLAVLLALALFRVTPRRWRLKLPPGGELILLALCTTVTVAAALTAADPLETALFDGDLQRFLFTELGIRYDQRNALVVGLALGFAVVPVIFTVAEDACSAVPQSLVNGARALGATRWQTAVRLVVPAASSGLFAAVMLGLGRAVGETMIVLMAAGNTPLLDFSPFNGMRTMSAAIAVEIPEAPVGGTLFRVLFLTGTLLFLLTLLLTSAADLVGAHLRKRYGRF